MRVLFVSNLFPSTDEPVRGLDNATLLPHIADTGVEVRVLALRPTLRPWRWGVNVREWDARPADRPFSPRYVGVPYVPRAGSRWNHRLAAAALDRGWKKTCGEFTPDVALASWLFPDGCAVAKLCGKDLPYLLICQGTDAHGYLRDPIRRKAIVEAGNQSAGVVTRSGDLGRLLSEAGVEKAKLHTVFNGVDPATFQPGEKASERRSLSLPAQDAAAIVLFVGNFLPVKNPLLLVEATSRLAGDLPPERSSLHLVLIGSGPMEGEIKAALQSSPLSGVTFAGRRDSAEVARFMRAADVLCLPSWNEGLPNVVLEAVACGLPVVASDVGGIGEVIDRPSRGHLVPAGQAGPLVNRLRQVLADPVDQGATSTETPAPVQTWPAAAGAYHDLLLAASGLG